MNEPHYFFEYKGTRAVIRLRGAQMASCVTPDGREMMWNADPSVWPQHAPLLFPICGRMKNDTVLISGKPYPMKQHGFTRDGSFRLLEEGDGFASFILQPNADTLAAYPFNFNFIVRYTLDETGYTTQITVENHDQTPMPFCVGGHPGFMLPADDSQRIEDYQLVFEKTEHGKNMISHDGIIYGSQILSNLAGNNIYPLSYADFDKKNALILDQITSQSVLLISKKTGRGLKFDYPDFSVLAIWSMPDKHAPYLCLQPWNGMPAAENESGELIEKPYSRLLQPGDCYRAQYSVHRI